jgi:hypothetical protein
LRVVRSQVWQTHHKACEHPIPALLGVRRRLIQHLHQIHVNDPRGMLGSLKIAAHPVKTIGNA